jgi:hypothetical protein
MTERHRSPPSSFGVPTRARRSREAACPADHTGVTPDEYPAAIDPDAVGTYEYFVGTGGYVWDAVLEYRVWCHPKSGEDDFYYAFATHAEAAAFADDLRDSDVELAMVEEPLALVLQEEYLGEPEPGEFIHVRQRRAAEWTTDGLSRPRRTPRTIPDFLSPNAPANRLDILRGLAPAPDSPS